MTSQGEFMTSQLVSYFTFVVVCLLFLIVPPSSGPLRTFPLALDIGAGKSHIAEHLNKVQ